MREIRLQECPLTDGEDLGLRDQLLGRGHHDKPVLGGPNGKDTIIRKPDGEPLLIYLRRPKLVQKPLQEALPALPLAARWSEKQQAKSGLIGFLDPTPQEPYFRVSAFTRDEPILWDMIQPLLWAMDDLLKAHLSDHRARQKAFWRMTNPDFRIPLTSFTTVTVNDKHQFKCHRHLNNLACGMGAMIVHRSGNFRGGYFMLPKWKVAVNMQCGDVVLFDGTDWHANSPFYADGDYERLSVVAYMRWKMIHAGSAAEELAKAMSLNK
jgi:hypothetical protein